MARGYVKSNNFSRDTLLAIATIGVITIAASTSPYFLHRLVKGYFQDKSEMARRKRAKKIRELEKRKLLNFVELGGGRVRVELTHRGQKLVREYDLEGMKLVKPERWDGRWRVIMYDIPSSQRKASDALREKFKDLDLFQLQKSVWISPYECLKELEFLSIVFEINMDKCIYYFHTREIPQEREVKKHFHL